MNNAAIFLTFNRRGRGGALMRHRPCAQANVLRTHSLVSLAALFSMSSWGCIGLFPFGDCLTVPASEGSVLFLHGDATYDQTVEVVDGASVRAMLLTDGEVTTRERASLPIAEDGTFEVPLSAKHDGPLCASPPDLPAPDQLEVIVTIRGCEQSFLIDINEDTVVDLDFPDRVIELKDPILVPACSP
jgi:hypothetical protein